MLQVYVSSVSDVSEVFCKYFVFFADISLHAIQQGGSGIECWWCWAEEGPALMFERRTAECNGGGPGVACSPFARWVARSLYPKLMLGVRCPSAPDAIVGGPNVQKQLFLSTPSAPHRSLQIKKNHASALPRLPHASLSFRGSRRPSSPLSRRPHRRGVLAARGRTTRLLMSPPPQAPRVPYRWGRTAPRCHPPPLRSHSRDPAVPCSACLTTMFC